MRRNGKEKKTTHTYDKQFAEFQENNGIHFADSKLLKQAENYKNISLTNIKQIQNEQITTPAER